MRAADARVGVGVGVMTCSSVSLRRLPARPMCDAILNPLTADGYLFFFFLLLFSNRPPPDAGPTPLSFVSARTGAVGRRRCFSRLAQCVRVLLVFVSVLLWALITHRTAHVNAAGFRPICYTTLGQNKRRRIKRKTKML